MLSIIAEKTAGQSGVLCVHDQELQQDIIKMANLAPAEGFQLLRGKAPIKMVDIAIFRESNSLPELTESWDVDGLGIFSFKGKKNKARRKIR